MSLFQLGVRGFALAEELALFFFLYDNKYRVTDISLLALTLREVKRGR